MVDRPRGASVPLPLSPRAVLPTTSTGVIWYGRRTSRSSPLSNLLVPSVPQWSSGYPDVEPKRALSLAKKLGYSGLPGLYLEMVQTWPALRTAYGQTLDAVSSVTVEAPPLEDETADEGRFNEALAELLLGRRCGIAMADGVRSGFGEILAQAFAAHAFGFAVLVPYWQGREEGETRGALEAGDVLVVEPVAQSSVNRWEPDLEANDYAGLRYYTSNGLARRNNYLERGRFLLFTHRAIPGQYYGDGELRALVPLYHLLASVRRQQYQINQRSAGIVVAREGMGSGNENRAALESQLERFGDGEPWVVVPHGAEFAVEFPSGSPPNLIEQIREIDAQALQMWASQMDVLGVSQTGSRAVADAMEAKSARVNANRIAPFVARVYERMGRWVANAEGYGGRIREAVPVGLQEVDRGARVELLAKAVTGGLMQWTLEDERRLREELDIQLAETEDAAPTPLSMLAKRPGPKSAAQTPAKPDERREGSERNPKGSAGSSRGGIEISDEQEEAIRNQIADYRERYPDAPKPDLGQLKAVYRRGAGAFSGSHRPGMTRAQWALARTKRFLTMLRGGKVKDAYRKADGDLLPEDHKARLGLARVLTVYAGPPCAGKSETAKRGEHGAIIDVDDLLDELGGYYSSSASRQAHALALQDLDDAVARGIPSIAVVAPLLSAKMRDEYAERAASAGYASRLVYVTAELPVLEGRNRKRSSRRLRMAALRAMAGDPPEDAAAFDRFDVLDTSARPPHGVRDAARNGIERHRAGETGDGIEPSTIAAARRLAKGDEIGEEQIRKGARFWSRNARFLDAEPGSAAWASAQLWGGRAGLTWYQSQADRLDRDAEAALASCGCGSCDVSDELAVEPPGGVIQTATGSSPHYRDGLEVTIRGVTVYPESYSTLETEIERRAAIDRQFDEVLDEVIGQVTDELEEAAEVSTTKLDEVEVEARQTVADAIEAFYLDVERAASTARKVESDNQADTQVRGPGIDIEAEDVDAPRVGFSAARIRQAAEAAARKMVGDIRGRLERFQVTTGSARGFRASPSAKRGKAYTIDAKPAANAIEAQGGELRPPRPGMVIVAAVRTSAKDNKVCANCRAEDGRVFLFPDEMNEFKAYRQLPDPLCSSTAKTGGRSLCRCKFLYLWGYD